jgi:hypothetical protein
MMGNPRKLFLAGSALLICSQALAEPFDGPGQQTRNWITNPTFSTTTVPADSLEPADVADSGFTESDWINVLDGTGYIKGASNERKIRLTCEPGTAKQLDPIVLTGQGPPSGHRHQGLGNVGWNQNSTFTTLRNSPSSTCTGGPLNSTIYWEPELLAPLNGVTVGIRTQDTIFYYIDGIQSDPQKLTWLRRGFSFIGGANFADYNDTTIRAELTAAGFEYPGSPDTPAGFQGWQCFTNPGTNLITVTRVASRMKSGAGIASTTAARHLKAEDGSDPWGGNCTGTLANPAMMEMDLIAPGCWDGQNLHSPTGRTHVAYAVRKSDNSVTDVCPDGWVHVPQLTAKSDYMFTGTEYLNWYYASDRMNAPSTPGDATSLDPCRQTGPYFCNGSTAHFDWMNGWKSSIQDEWERECLGITVRGVAPTNGPAECATNLISKFRGLKYGGASPDVNMSGGCTTLGACSNAVPGNNERYAPIASGTIVDPTLTHSH